MKISDTFASLLAGQDLSLKVSCWIFRNLFLSSLRATQNNLTQSVILSATKDLNSEILHSVQNDKKRQIATAVKKNDELAMTNAEAKNLLILLARKGEAPDEIAGCLAALKSLENPRKTGILHLMDTCGTGGDGSHSANISTLAALVIAGAGGKIAKHGNRSLSSKCGSSDLLEALGVNLNAGENKMVQSIRESGIGYFHAPFFHPVFSRMQPLRKSLGIRTIFNFLGPLANPLELSYQLIGVSKKEMVKTFAEVLRQKKIHHALVCHSENGLDELTTTAAAFCAEVQKGRIQYFTLEPGKLGFKKASVSDLRGGNISRNKQLALKLLSGKTKDALRDTVILNAGAGLWISGISKNLKDGITLARKSLDNGNAYSALQNLVKISC